MKAITAALFALLIVSAALAQAPAATSSASSNSAISRASAAASRGASADAAGSRMEHWVATWGAAQTPARIPPAPPTLAARGAQSAAPNAQNPSAGGSATVAGPPAPPVMNAPGATATPAASAAGAPARRFNNPPAERDFNNQTVRMILRTSIGGDTLRVRLYNAFGAPTVKVGAAHVALHAKDSAIVPDTDHELTFSGKPTATMYAGEVLISDPVKLKVTPLSDLAVSLYFPGDTGAPTTHGLGLRPAYTSTAGDFTAAPEISGANVTQSYYWLEGVDVVAPADAAAIVTFGDSITDGDQSTPGMDAMWPAILAERLQAKAATRHIAVVNEGISGNRILGDNVGGLVRIRHEGIDVPGVKWITVLEGINDINLAMRTNAEFSAEDLIAAYQQIIAEAHAHGIKVIGCTMTPYGGSSGYKDAGEAIREAANQWIRSSGQFDAVIDFEKATRDAADPKRFSAAADSPDMLHPGDAGYKLMGDAIDLSIFAPNAGTRAK